MSKHVLDRPRMTATTRIRSYLEAARRDGLHPSISRMIRRGRPETGLRLQHYLRLARQNGGAA